MISIARARLHARFALAVLVLAALAPGISRCLAFASPASFWLTATCSAAAAPDGGSSPAASQGMGIDCPMCVVQALPAILPQPAAAPVWRVLETRRIAPSYALPVRRAEPAHSIARSRAPPAFA